MKYRKKTSVSQFCDDSVLLALLSHIYIYTMIDYNNDIYIETIIDTWHYRNEDKSGTCAAL